VTGSGDEPGSAMTGDLHGISPLGKWIVKMNALGYHGSDHNATAAG